MALGKLFDIVGGKIVPKEDCYIIEPLKAIMTEYPDKNTHNKIYAFLHYMKSLNKTDNPYAEVDLDDREEIVLRRLKLDIDTQSNIIKQALECVEECYYTTFYGLYRGIKKQLDTIGKKLLTTEINFEKDGNAIQITRFMEKYEFLRKSFKIAYQDFEEEQGFTRNRGGGESAYDEDDD